MTKEKIIKGLEHCTNSNKTCSKCPYEKKGCANSQNILKDALTLIKSQGYTIEALYGYLKAIRQDLIRIQDFVNSHDFNGDMFIAGASNNAIDRIDYIFREVDKD